MSAASETVDIRSYRRVFDLERRIYRIDQLRLNPGGIPVRGVVYFLVSLLTLLVLGVMPLTRIVVHMFPWYIRDLGLPGGLAAVLTMMRVEGRPFHLAAMSLVRFLSSPRHLSGMQPCTPLGTRWHPDELLFLPDGSDARLRRLRFSGPGVALVSVPHQREVLRGTLKAAPRVTLRALSGHRPGARGQLIELRRGVCLHVQSGPRQSCSGGSRRRPSRARVSTPLTSSGRPRRPPVRHR